MTTLDALYKLLSKCTRSGITNYPDCRGLMVDAGASRGLTQDAINTLVDSGKFVATSAASDPKSRQTLYGK